MFEIKEFSWGPNSSRMYFSCPDCYEVGTFFTDTFGCEYCDADIPSASHLKLSYAARLRWHLLGKLEPLADDICLCGKCVWRDDITNLRNEDMALCDGCHSFSNFQEDLRTC